MRSVPVRAGGGTAGAALAAGAVAALAAGTVADAPLEALTVSDARVIAAASSATRDSRMARRSAEQCRGKHFTVRLEQAVAHLDYLAGS